MPDDTPAPPCAWIAMPSTFNVMKKWIVLVEPLRHQLHLHAWHAQQHPAVPISLMQSSRAESFTIILRNLLC
ncbi:hypothetical protein GQ457_13G024680 [Hibiscus cannabinus]